MAKPPSQRGANETIRQILADHGHVQSTLAKLTSCQSLSEAHQLLAELEPELAHHFAHEEDPDGGLFASITRRAPHLHTRLQKCMAEHGELLVEVHALAERTESAGDSAKADLFAEIEALAARVRAHEACEAEVLTDSWCLDLGEQD